MGKTQNKKDYFKNTYKNFNKIFGLIKGYETEHKGKNLILKIRMENYKYAFNMFLNEDETKDFIFYTLGKNEQWINHFIKRRIILFKNLVSDAFNE